MPDLEKLRFEFACAALAGLLADHKDHPEDIIPPETCPQTVARLAFDHADAMISELQKRTPKTNSCQPP